MGYVKFYFENLRKTNLKMARFHWSRNSRDSCPTSSDLTLNFEKCKFLKKNLAFFGLVFTEQGVGPDPKKVEAFAKTQPPTTVSEVRSLLGMANYSSKFIKDHATITEPLRELTRKNTRFM